jgi:hypothetical protein
MPLVERHPGPCRNDPEVRCSGMAHSLGSGPVSQLAHESKEAVVFVRWAARPRTVDADRIPFSEKAAQLALLPPQRDLVLQNVFSGHGMRCHRAFAAQPGGRPGLRGHAMSSAITDARAGSPAPRGGRRAARILHRDHDHLVLGLFIDIHDDQPAPRTEDEAVSLPPSGEFWPKSRKPLKRPQ